jgi:hypothetical protein
MFDYEIDEIIRNDRERSLKVDKELSMSKHVDFQPLVEICQTILFQKGINNGNLYADTLANMLLETGKISIIK